MKNQNRLLICLLTGFLALFPSSLFAQSYSITLVASFDYPGAGNSTTPFGINRGGDIAGYFLNSSGATRGFIRFRDGSFSAPLVEPSDTGNFTRGAGINSVQTVVGDFFNVGDNSFHGYFLSGGVFTQFDFGGPFSTNVTGINDAGDFVGTFGNVTQPNQGFVNVGGTSTVITIPGATLSFAYGINNLDRAVGTYTDSASIVHGFLRDSSGALTAPLDFPGSTSTEFLGINDRGWIVGRYQVGDGLIHGLFLKLPNTFVSFDFPGAVETSLNGINNAGLISGRYTDGAGIRHGFVARVRRTAN
ncbi:MAG: hypothetical protein H0X40_05305 [Chthoniobacterales bacterium]|nr:hypothetical protein [Chthoniobacterales bacterium]